MQEGPDTQIFDVQGLLERKSFTPHAVLFGTPFFLVGAYLAGASLGWWPLIGDAVVPVWTLGLLGLAFTIIGLLFVGGGIRAWRRARRHAKAGVPWAADYPWDPVAVTYNPYAECLKYIMASLFLVGFMAPFNWLALFGNEKSLTLIAFVVVLDIPMALVLVGTLLQLGEAAKYGVSQLYLPACPLRPAGRKRFGLQAPHFPTVRVTLRYVRECFVTLHTDEGLKTRPEAYLLFAQTREIPWPANAGILPIDLDWPGGPEEVNRFHADDHIQYWELLVDAAGPGIDYHAAFPLPVYDVPESQVRPNGPWPRSRPRKRLPYAFELGVLALLLLLWGLYWMLSPGGA